MTDSKLTLKSDFSGIRDTVGVKLSHLFQSQVIALGIIFCHWMIQIMAFKNNNNNMYLAKEYKSYNYND